MSLKLSKSTLPLMLTPFMLAACSFPNVSSNTPSPTVTTESVPDSLGFQAPTTYGTLSDTDRAAVAKAVAVNPKTLTYPSQNLSVKDLADPSQNLFLEDPANPSASQVQQTAALKALTDQTAYNLLNDYQTNCVYPTINPTTTMGSEPLGGWNFDLLQVGNQLNSSGSIALYSSSTTAPACPIAFSGNIASNRSVFAIDHTAKSATYNYNLSGANLVIGLNPTYAAAYGVSSISVGSTATGVTMVHLVDASNNISSTNMSFSLHGTFVGLNATVPFTLTVQSLRKVKADKSSTTETILTSSIFASPTAIVTVHKMVSEDSSGNQVASASDVNDIYLNNLKTTQQDLYNLFGDSVQVMVGNLDIVKNLTLK